MQSVFDIVHPPTQPVLKKRAERIEQYRKLKYFKQYQTDFASPSCTISAEDLDAIDSNKLTINQIANKYDINYTIVIAALRKRFS